MVRLKQEKNRHVINATSTSLLSALLMAFFYVPRPTATVRPDRQTVAARLNVTLASSAGSAEVAPSAASATSNASTASSLSVVEDNN